MYYQIIKVGKDEIGLVWDEIGKKVRVESIYLPGKIKMTSRIGQDFPAIHKIPRTVPGGLDQLIVNLYGGKKQNCDLSVLNFSKLTEFSARVLKQAYKIPHGKVATYAGLAAKVGNPRAARAVGTALAKNPFPIIIPCHRVVRTDGSPGQFGGGSAMKQHFLKKEGIILDKQGRVPSDNIS